jgi:hypothetical protein
VEVELGSGYEIRGRIAVDGPERIDFSRVVLNFGGEQVKLDSDGIFQTNVFGDRAIFTLHGLIDDWYVREFQVAGKRVAGRQFKIEPGTTDVAITLRARGARVSIGMAGTSPGDMAVVMVALLPETGATPDVESILQAQADDSGKFIVRAVPPGSYRVFSLDASSWPLLMRPDLLLEKYRSQAPLITVAEGEEKALVIQPLQFKPE